jgi:hypothetical protein
MWGTPMWGRAPSPVQAEHGSAGFSVFSHRNAQPVEERRFSIAEAVQESVGMPSLSLQMNSQGWTAMGWAARRQLCRHPTTIKSLFSMIYNIRFNIIKVMVGPRPIP